MHLHTYNKQVQQVSYHNQVQSHFLWHMAQAFRAPRLAFGAWADRGTASGRAEGARRQADRCTASDRAAVPPAADTCHGGKRGAPDRPARRCSHKPTGHPRGFARGWSSSIRGSALHIPGSAVLERSAALHSVPRTVVTAARSSALSSGSDLPLVAARRRVGVCRLATLTRREDEACLHHGVRR